jgi:hypothetical protein
MNHNNYFLWDYLIDRLYCTNTHTVQKLQAEIEAVTEEITDDILRDALNDFVVYLQWVHEVDVFHT